MSRMSPLFELMMQQERLGHPILDWDFTGTIIECFSQYDGGVVVKSHCLRRRTAVKM
jgi:hypothetical protein